MFDFDEIEETAEREGGWREEAEPTSPSQVPKENAQGPNADATLSPKDEGGMFDFDDLEEKPQKATSTKGVSINVEVAFQHQGEKWHRKYEVMDAATVLDLKKQICQEVDQLDHVQLCRFGRPLANDELLKKDERLDFGFVGRRLESDRVRPTKASSWYGAEEVTIFIDAALDVVHTRRVQEGTSVADLKTAMAKEDPTGATRPEDFDLGITGGSGRALATDVVLSAVGIRQLDLLQPVVVQ